MNPLAFLVPAFLAGLVALTIPVLVHLRHKERKDPVRFPSLMFLRRIPFREVRRQQIQHWPLFLLRALAVALLVLAFARPFFRAMIRRWWRRSAGSRSHHRADRSARIWAGGPGQAAARRR
jgi:hypothetical protein